MFQTPAIRLSQCQLVWLLELVLPQEFRKDSLARQKPAGLHAQSEVADRSGGSSIPIDERVDVIDLPQNESCQANWIRSLLVPIDRVGEIIHHRLHTKPLRWFEHDVSFWSSHFHSTWTIGAGEMMQSDDGVKVDGLDHGLRNKRTLYVQRSLDHREQKIVVPITV